MPDTIETGPNWPEIKIIDFQRRYKFGGNVDPLDIEIHLNLAFGEIEGFYAETELPLRAEWSVIDTTRFKEGLFKQAFSLFILEHRSRLEHDSGEDNFESIEEKSERLKKEAKELLAKVTGFIDNAGSTFYLI